MRSHAAWLISVICGPACVDSAELESEARTLGVDAPEEIRMISPGTEPDVCELLPACGPCSVACDYEQLSTHVPPGTCAAFVCELDDGRVITVHACHPG